MDVDRRVGCRGCMESLCTVTGVDSLCALIYQAIGPSSYTKAPGVYVHPHPYVSQPSSCPSHSVRLSSSSCREAVTERSVAAAGGGLLCTDADPASPPLLSPRARRRPVTLRRGERLPSAACLVPTSWPARSSCRNIPPPNPRFLSSVRSRPLWLPELMETTAFILTQGDRGYPHSGEYVSRTRWRGRGK
jgi:hypothetical protein